MNHHIIPNWLIESIWLAWTLASITVRHPEWQIDWLTGRWLIDWLIDWLIGWLIDWLIDCLMDWLIDWLTDWLRSTHTTKVATNGWMIERLTIDWLIDRDRIDWLIDWLMNDQLSDRLRLDWLIDWLHRLWLMDWLIETGFDRVTNFRDWLKWLWMK